MRLDHKNSNGQAPYGAVYVAGIRVYFSYSTIIAMYDGTNLYHVHNTWGPTTGKHINALFTRAFGTEVSTAELDRLIEERLVTYGLNHVKDRLDGKKTSIG